MSENRIAPSKREAPERLQRDLGRGVGIVDQVEEAALVGPQRAIFGQVAPGLAHQPHRRRIAPLAAQHGEQGLVGVGGDGAGGRSGEEATLYLLLIYIIRLKDGVLVGALAAGFRRASRLCQQVAT